MAAVSISNIRDLKRQSVQTGFPVPVNKQMQQLAKGPRRKLKFPSPKRKAK